MTLISNAVPEKTQRKADWAYNVFVQWARWKVLKCKETPAPYEAALIQHEEDLLGMSQHDMDSVLANFLHQVRKTDGSRYPGKTLHEIVTSIQKKMELKGRKLKLIDSKVFPQTYYALDIEMKTSTEQGLGMNTKQAQPLTMEMEEQLWTDKILGTIDGDTLLKTAFFAIGINFGLRAGKEHRDLSIKNFSFASDADGRQYVCYSQTISKTNQGGVAHRKVAPHSARAYENLQNPNRCPVQILKLYISKCPPEAMEKAFYLKPLSKPKNNLWFSKMPIGHNTLAVMVSSMMKQAGINGYFTNHSLRATTVTRLFHHGVDDKIIKAQTGHRSDAVNSYKRISDTQLHDVSNIIQNAKRPKMEQSADKQLCPNISATFSDNAGTSRPSAVSVENVCVIPHGPTSSSPHMTLNVYGGHLSINM
jgi:hypothetical protein